jgi:hypothetical protein
MVGKKGSSCYQNTVALIRIDLTRRNNIASYFDQFSSVAISYEQVATYDDITQLIDCLGTPRQVGRIKALTGGKRRPCGKNRSK